MADWPFRSLVDVLENFPDRPAFKTRKAWEVKSLVVHHTATGATASPEDLHRAQQQRNFGTAETPLFPPRITYHGVISPDGTQWKTNDYSAVGWNAPGYNRS